MAFVSNAYQMPSSAALEPGAGATDPSRDYGMPTGILEGSSSLRRTIDLNKGNVYIPVMPNSKPTSNDDP